MLTNSGHASAGLLQELQHALGHLIRLGQHGLGRLDQDVVLGVGHHLVGHIGVADGGLSILDVFLHDGEVVDGMVQTCLLYTSPSPRDCS